MTISLSPFTTTRDSDGPYSLTLAQLTSVFISEIERLLGPRDPNFTYVGLEFDTTPDAKPHIWFLNTGYPGHETENGSNHIVIRLTANAQTDANLAIWQLARQCLHLIDPWNIEVERRPTNYLEEGLAAWYQNTIIQNIPLDPRYEEAKSLVEPCMPELATAIKHIRTKHNLRISAIDDRDVAGETLPGDESKTCRNTCVDGSHRRSILWNSQWCIIRLRSSVKLGYM